MTVASSSDRPAGSSFDHQSVMLEEVVGLLAPARGGLYADVTVGGGGHAEVILERSAPDGLVVAIDRDPSALEAARQRLERFGNRVRFLHGDMGDVHSLLSERGMGQVQGLVADLGVSSPQLDTAERGFSFRHDGPLDMRMNPAASTTARSLIAELSTEALGDVIYQFGEERRSRAIARSIHDELARGCLRYNPRSVACGASGNGSQAFSSR